MEDYEPSPRTEVRRRSQRGRHDKATVHAVLDEASQCHVDFVVEGSPVVIPTAFGRGGERLYLRDAPLSRMLSTLAVQRKPPRRHRQNGSGQR